MKKPDEIKKGLECDRTGDCNVTQCAYFRSFDCLHDRHFDGLAYIQQLEDHIRDLTNMVDRFKATRPKWISAKDNPPENWRSNDNELINFLVYSPNYGVDVGNYFKSANVWLIMGSAAYVTHWMPLPEQPSMIEHANNALEDK